MPLQRATKYRRASWVLGLALPVTWAWAASFGGLVSVVCAVVTSLGAAAYIGILVTRPPRTAARLQPVVVGLALVALSFAGTSFGRLAYRIYVTARLLDYQNVAVAASRRLAETPGATQIVLQHPLVDLAQATASMSPSGEVQVTFLLAGSGRRVLVYGAAAPRAAGPKGACLTKLKGDWYWYEPCASDER